MRSAAEDDFLRRLNADLPEGVDWKQGAVTYLRELVVDGGADTERFHLVKPFLGGPDFDPFWVDVFQFLDVIRAVNLPGRNRILDVGCGPGWTVHWLAKLGHEVIGLDISAELLEIAERRMRSDPFPPFVEEPFAYDLRVHDIEAEPLHLERPVDLALFESTLHHFFDPVSALRNTAIDLADTGVVAVIEASAPPVGSIWHDQNFELMRRYHTIERPYSRDQLYEMLDLAGLPHVEFYRPINGLFRQDVDAVNRITNELTHADNINILLAGKSREAVARLAPDTRPLGEQRQGLRFLEGFSFREERPDGTHYRWCGPRGLVAAGGPGPQRICVENVMLDRKERQTVYVLVNGRVAQQVELAKRSPRAELVVDVGAHTLIELHSNHAFSPAWQGSGDARVLSFTVEDP